MKKSVHLLAILVVLLMTGCVRVATLSPERDESWAKPCQIAGVKNCFMLEPGLYRSAQPTAQGIANLNEMGITNILSLRHGSKDNRLARDTLLRCHHVIMSAFSIDEEALLEALAIMVAERNRPLLVHCFHGADRTGVAYAAYRVVVQDWSKEKAIEEMRCGQFGFHGFLMNAVASIRKLDVEKARRRLGIQPK